MKNRRNTVTGMTAVGMSFLMAVSPLCVIAEETAKDETVYVSADATGEVQKVTVSNWLKNDGQQGELQDESNLTDIQNVKGDETYTAEDNRLVWQTEGEDIYYTGESEQKPPVSVSFTYYLDGNKISPEELKGKSGHLQIQITYTNNAKQVVTIDGKQEEVYSPFLMCTGMILKEDTFQNVMIDNGKVISDGDKYIVIGYGMPGLAKSLGISDEMEGIHLPESLTITADVTNFSMGETYTFASSDIFQDLKPDEIGNMDELTAALDQLEDASLQLVEGSEKLSSGSGELDSQYEKFDAGIGELKDGIALLQNGSTALSQGVNTYTQGADQLNDGIQTYLSKEGVLTGSVKEYQNGVNTAVMGIEQYADGTLSLAGGVEQYVAGEQQLSQGMEQLSSLSDGLTKTKDAIAQLHAVLDGEGTSEEDILVATETLNKGMRALHEAVNSTDAETILAGADALSQELDNLETTMKTSLGSGLETISAKALAIEEECKAINTALASLQESEQEKINAAVQQATDAVNGEIAERNVTLQQISNDISSDAESQANGQLETIRNSLRAQADTAMAEGDAKSASALNAAADALTDIAVTPKTVQGIANITAPTVTAEPVQVSTENLKASLTDLSNAAVTMQTSVSSVKTEAENLLEKMNAIKDQLSSSSMSSLPETTGQLSAGMNKLSSAIQSLAKNIGQLDSETEAFSTASKGIAEMQAGFETMDNSNEKLLAGAKLLKDNSPAILSGTSQLQDGTDQLMNGLDKLSSQLTTGAGALSSGSAKLRLGATDLVSGINSLGDGADTLQSGSTQLKDGISTLHNGAVTLSDAMKQFQNEGVHALTTTVEDELGDVLDRLKVLTSPECAYQSFSGKQKDMAGEVKFIITTEEIKAE